MLGLAESGGIFVNSTSGILVSIATTLVALWVWSQQRPRKDFPPGPKGWPLIGNILGENIWLKSLISYNGSLCI